MCAYKIITTIQAQTNRLVVNHLFTLGSSVRTKTTPSRNKLRPWNNTSNIHSGTRH